MPGRILHVNGTREERVLRPPPRSHPALVIEKRRAAAMKRKNLPLKYNVPPGFSFLEAATVRPATQCGYRLRLLEFLDWVVTTGLSWASFGELDRHLVSFPTLKF